MKIWVDDVRPAPKGYEWIKTTEGVIERIKFLDDYEVEIELLDLDHDAGQFAAFGGDYIKILDYLEETGRNYPIRIHSMNVVGRENMRRIIQRNGWTEVR
jgi:hypothetical protein